MLAGNSLSNKGASCSARGDFLICITRKSASYRNTCDKSRSNKHQTNIKQNKRKSTSKPSPRLLHRSDPHSATISTFGHSLGGCSFPSGWNTKQRKGVYRKEAAR